MANNGIDLGNVLRERRRTAKLTLQRLSSLSGVSPSHLARIERKERFPSARVLRKIAKPLNFEENELFTLAGYLTNSNTASIPGQYGGSTGLDPYVASVLAKEPLRIQRAIIDVVTLLHTVGEDHEHLMGDEEIISAK